MRRLTRWQQADRLSVMWNLNTVGLGCEGVSTEDAIVIQPPLQQKEINMDRRSILLMISASALTACAPQPYSNPLSREARAGLAFSRFDVVTTGASFDSRLASDYASRLGPDLAAALRSEFSDRIRADGVVMNVEIARFNLAGSTRTAMGRDQSQLQGSVRIIDSAGRLLATYPIQVVAGAAAETHTGALARAAVDKDVSTRINPKRKSTFAFFFRGV